MKLYVFKSKYFQRIMFIKGAPLFQQMSQNTSNTKFLMLEMSKFVQFLTSYKPNLIFDYNKELKACIRAKGAVVWETQIEVAT